MKTYERMLDQIRRSWDLTGLKAVENTQSSLLMKRIRELENLSLPASPALTSLPSMVSDLERITKTPAILDLPNWERLTSKGDAHTHIADALKASIQSVLAS